ncbi:hypothetical protein NXC14_PA00313 (plasmid) [Rhizobium sp. NXC14]|nr:hypothetical protein NXC14_PA00313 [Rhizobium sp. NXC14]
MPLLEHVERATTGDALQIKTCGAISSRPDDMLDDSPNNLEFRSRIILVLHHVDLSDSPAVNAPSITDISAQSNYPFG